MRSQAPSQPPPARTTRPRGRAGGFTLIELLAVITVLGIAGAMVIPAMGQTGILRVQGAVRSIVSDITYAQSDAVAFQERRAVCFDTQTSSYRLVEVPGDTIDPALNTMYDPSAKGGLYVVTLGDGRFGDARILSASFDGQPNLIFDALGGPVATASGNTSGSGGTVVVSGANQRFTITVEPFTGRVTVTRVGP